MGSDTTAGGIKKQFTRSYRVLAARQDALCADGKDPKDASLEHLGAHKRSGDISAGQEILPSFFRNSNPNNTHVFLMFKQSCHVSRGCQVYGVSCHYCRCEDAIQSTHQTSLCQNFSGTKRHRPQGCFRQPRKWSEVLPISFFQFLQFPFGAVYGKVLFCPNYTDSPKPPETARIMGSDTTPSSLINHFRRTVKILADRQVSMLAAGEDSKDVSLEMLGLGQSKGGQKFCLLSFV